MKKLLAALLALTMLLCVGAAGETNASDAALSLIDRLRQAIQTRDDATMDEVMQAVEAWWAMNPEAERDDDVTEYVSAALSARDALLREWRGEYAQEMYEGHSGYLEIRSTRVFRIAEEPVSHADQRQDEIAQQVFGDVKYVVEFVLFSDYQATEPYYFWAGLKDHVTVSPYGGTTVTQNPFNLYRGRTYMGDFTGIIEDTVDLGYALNGVYRLRVS